MSLQAASSIPPSQQPRFECLIRTGGWTQALCGTTLAIAVMLAPSLGFAQASTPVPAASAAPAGSVALPPIKIISPGVSWAELTPEQRQALAPLASSWNGINEQQKRKWLEISKNYRTLTSDEQAKLNSRMNEWVALSPQQRAQARLNFGKTKELARELTPEEKKAQWEAYQALSPEEKEKLAGKASPKPRGAAPAVKPVAPQKLAVLPAEGHQPASAPRPAPKIAPSAPALPASAVTAPAGTALAPVGAASAAPQR